MIANGHTNGDYHRFLASKSQLGEQAGFEPNFMPDFLYPFQRFLVDWSIRMGRAGVFADCGLGKGPMQLVWAENVVRHTNRPVLILAPLAVAQQFKREAEKFDVEAHVSTDGKPRPNITIANYERLHKFDMNDYSGVACDEASIIKHWTGATQKSLTRFLSKLQYRLLSTATPAPNDYLEMGVLSEALGGITHTEMLGVFFRQLNDDEKKKRATADDVIFSKRLSWRVIQSMGQWALRPHAFEPFWKWVASWARACRKPSDLGDFDDSEFILPPLIRRDHEVIPRTAPPGYLFTIPAFGVNQERGERLRTLDERSELVAELTRDSDSAIVWCLPPDEPVVMGDGTDREIAAIDVGDFVVSGEGIPRRVSHVLTREHSGSLISVRVRGVARPIRVTPEHRIPTGHGWKSAGSLSIGDRLIEPRIEMIPGGDYESGWIVGIYASQGSRVRGPNNTWNRVCMTTHRDKAPEIAARLGSFLGRPPQVRPQGKAGSTAKAVDVQISDHDLRILVDSWVIGNTAPTKRLARMPMETDFARGVLDGWLAGDGTIVNGGRRREGQTSSPSLARQMALIAGSLGFATFTNTGPNRPGPKARAGGNGTLHPHDWHRVGISNDVGHYAQPLIEPDRILREIVGIEVIPYSGPVFDFTVETDHTFLTRGITVSNCHLNPEGDRLEREIRGAVQVKGSQSLEEKEERILAFLDGQARVLVTKPKIAGLGLNLQHCAHVVCFVDHSYEKFYQCIRRCYRFGQKRPVTLDVIATEGEVNVRRNMERKERLASQMFDQVIGHMNDSLGVKPGRNTLPMEVPSWIQNNIQA